MEGAALCKSVGYLVGCALSVWVCDLALDSLLFCVWWGLLRGILKVLRSLLRFFSAGMFWVAKLVGSDFLAGRSLPFGAGWQHKLLVSDYSVSCPGQSLLGFCCFQLRFALNWLQASLADVSAALGVLGVADNFLAWWRFCQATLVPLTLFSVMWARG